MKEEVSAEELNQRWRLNWIDCIFEFSNIQFQKMLWIEGSSAKWPNDQELVSDFNECFADYFDGQ